MLAHPRPAGPAAIRPHARARDRRPADLGEGGAERLAPPCRGARHDSPSCARSSATRSRLRLSARKSIHADLAPLSRRRAQVSTGRNGRRASSPSWEVAPGAVPRRCPDVQPARRTCFRSTTGPAEGAARALFQGRKGRSRASQLGPLGAVPSVAPGTCAQPRKFVQVTLLARGLTGLDEIFSDPFSS